jgi:aquaporin Z
MSPLARRSLAEGIGTFGFVFLGCASAVSNLFPVARYDILGIALVHAAALGLFVSATLGVSGGHLNPAVTLGLLSGKRIDARSAAAYIAAQLVGAVLAVVLVKQVFPAGVMRTSTLGTPAVATNLTFVQALGLETVGTFILMSAVYGTIVQPERPRLGGFGVGVALLAIVLVLGPVTGGAVNPARAFGPALVSGTWVGQAIWWIGPLLGAILAAQLWERGLLEKK